MSKMVELTGYQVMETLRRAERRGKRSQIRILWEMILRFLI